MLLQAKAASAAQARERARLYAEQSRQALVMPRFQAITEHIFGRDQSQAGANMQPVSVPENILDHWQPSAPSAQARFGYGGYGPMGRHGEPLETATLHGNTSNIPSSIQLNGPTNISSLLRAQQQDAVVICVDVCRQCAQKSI